MVNKIENTIIAAGTFILTTLVITLLIHFVSIKPLQKQLDKQTQVIVELAKIEKYKIANDFGKMKPKKGADIILDLNNSLNALQLADMPQDTIPPEEIGFLERIFKHKNKTK